MRRQLLSEAMQSDERRNREVADIVEAELEDVGRSESQALLYRAARDRPVRVARRPSGTVPRS